MCCHAFVINLKKEGIITSINIKQINIIDSDCECIVNAANSGLLAGGGVCGSVFSAAGYMELTRACDAIGHCDVGSAVITDGFKLSKYIIHAVGPKYNDGNHGESDYLYSCYKSCLDLTIKHNIKSIAFPLISAGIYHYPAKEAIEVAINSCTDWQKENNYEIDIVFAILDINKYQYANEYLKQISE